MSGIGIRKTSKLLQAGTVATLCCIVSATATAKGKPQEIEPVSVDIVGGVAAAGPVDSYDVNIAGGKKNPALEIVVRNVDLTFVFGRDSGLNGFDTCFGDSDMGAAGKLILDDTQAAVLEIYPEYFAKNGDLQQYQLILTGMHDYGDSVGSFPASGAVEIITATFDNVQVSAEGRGKQRDACTGSFDSATDGFDASATVDR